MKRLFAFIIVISLMALSSCDRYKLIKDFSGEAAYEHVSKIVETGSRLPGSQGSAMAQNYIVSALSSSGIAALKQPFEAQTPIGAVTMTNVLCKLNYDPVAASQNIIVVGTHYDTKYLEGIDGFVGANDGGSGVGILLELAFRLSKTELKNSVWLVFFDGEESYKEESSQDWFYGSRFFVSELKSGGKLGNVKRMILLDMVGDKDFSANLDLNSDKNLIERTRIIARQLGYESHFFGKSIPVSDDHTSFINEGIPAIDIIDFEYGGNYTPGYYWHTTQDTLDKISPETLKIVGDVTLNLIVYLDKEI